MAHPDRQAAPSDDSGALQTGDDPDQSQSSATIHKAVALLVGISVVIAALLAIFATRHTKELQPGQPVPAIAEVDSLLSGVPQHGLALGSRRAPATLVEMADLQCVPCAAFEKEALPVLIEDYIRPGKLKIVFRPLSFVGPGSLQAAKMAAALGVQGKAWQFIDLMFHNQGPEGTHYVTGSYLAALVTAIPGARLPRALVAEGSDEVATSIARSTATANRMHLTADPSFLLSMPGERRRQLAASEILNTTTFARILSTS